MQGETLILQNMAVTTSLNPTVEGKRVQFLGFDHDGKAASYLLLVKTAELANQVAENIKKEVEEVKKG